MHLTLHCVAQGLTIWTSIDHIMQTGISRRLISIPPDIESQYCRLVCHLTVRHFVTEDALANNNSSPEVSRQALWMTRFVGERRGAHIYGRAH